jgi:DEAD/DEAH box helicase domain-containing protein
VGDGQGSWFAVVGADGRGQLRGADNAPLAGGELAGRFEPTLFLYDNYPGGVGLSAPLFDAAAGLLAEARALVRGCACGAGCPACIGPILPGDEQRVSTPKELTLAVLALFGGRARMDARGPRAEGRGEAAGSPAASWRGDA